MDQLTSPLVSSRADIRHIAFLENELIEAGARLGVTMKRSPGSTYIHLLTLPVSHITNVAKHLTHVIGTFEICSKEEINPWDDKEFFRLSMRRMGITFPSDLLQNVSDGDLIEGYDMSRFQIFRNLRFMEKSGYSLLDMLSFEWPMLFDRPGQITEQMISYCDEILWTENRTIMFDISNHFMRELRSPDRLMFEVEFKYLSPLFTGPDKPFGIVGTFGVTQISAHDSPDKLSFV